MHQLLLLWLALLPFTGITQTTLPVIHSDTNVIDVRDGGVLNIGQWTLVPEVKPDVYTSSYIGQEVTFYTDLDSISFLVHPDSVYNFVIVYDGDSAYTQVSYVPSRLDILKGAKLYDPNDAVEVPAFTYQDASDPHLQELRKAFHLDSIAGSGDEVSKVLNLLHWVHDLVPHDGNHENPTVRNAMSMIHECKRDERGLNCRGLAIVLNECYLPLGIKSRFVTCMPKDSIFDDCHVINMVYINSLQKWIWVDPTHEAYVMDEAGNLLSIAEVRYRLVEDLPLELNPEANWNHQSTTTKEQYLYEYMAKNLYRFKCPLNSEYNYETKKRGKKVTYVELLPLDGLNQTPKVSSHKSKKTGVTSTVYKTNNPDQFWTKP